MQQLQRQPQQGWAAAPAAGRIAVPGAERIAAAALGPMRGACSPSEAVGVAEVVQPAPPASAAADAVLGSAKGGEAGEGVVVGQEQKPASLRMMVVEEAASLHMMVVEEAEGMRAAAVVVVVVGAVEGDTRRPPPSVEHAQIITHG